MESLHISPDSFRYRGMIGTGGIGSGSFFVLNGNETLGREESRSGHFLDRRDYCKLHIISHYVRALLGPAFLTLPIGKVGEDEVGKRLCAEMGEVGLDMRYVEQVSGLPTLFAFCYIYPDGSGGNLSTDDSASAHVDAAAVLRAAGAFLPWQGNGVALAAPEVPIEARAALLKLATEHCFFRVASFTSEEMADAFTLGMLREVDLLAINIDEATAAAGFPATADRAEIIHLAVVRFHAENPAMLVSVTAGKDGVWYSDGTRLDHRPAFLVPAESTAGAGDAHTAGMIVGLTAGLPFADAVQLGTLVAALSVTSPHTIHPGIDRQSLRVFVGEHGLEVSENNRMMLEGVC